jgi:hypothetical protein
MLTSVAWSRTTASNVKGKTVLEWFHLQFPQPGWDIHGS